MISEIEIFRSSLSDFVSNSNKYLPLRKKMGIQDIDFTKDSKSNNSNDNFFIQVKAELN